MNLSFFNKPKPVVQLDNKIFTVAFYNLENLFDTEDDPTILDDDFTPSGKKKWNKKRYEKKIHKLGKAIANIAFDSAKKPPSLVGIAEVENKRVIADLVASKALRKHNFGWVHFNSPDERGIDTALLYCKKHFKVNTTEVHTVLVYNEEGERDYTRDILEVSGWLNGAMLHILVNHWPSRRQGAEATSYKRITAAKKVVDIVNNIKEKDTNAHIIVMGDFNDDPFSESIQTLVNDAGLFNPMQTILNPYKRGSLNHKGNWNLFDQIMFTDNFLQNKSGKLSFAHADIFDKRFLSEWKGKYKGNPFRTYVGKKYLGGYSDHFPVYVQLHRNTF